MPDDIEVAESSTAEATPTLESLSSDQLREWQLTGELPAKPADTPPAKAVEKTPPATTPATPAETKESDEADVEGLNPRTKARIQKLLRERAERDARIAELEKRPAEPEKVAKTDSTPAAKDGLQPPVKPKQDDFDTWEKYQDAKDKYTEDLIDYKADVKAAAKVAEAETKRAERDQTTEVGRKWNERVEAAKLKHADLSEVLKVLPPYNEAAVGFVMDSEVGPEILYYLGSNLEEAERIKGLNPYQTARELTRIEDSLKKPATPTAKKVPTAPPPPSEVGGKSSSTIDEADAALEAGDQAKYTRIMNEREIASNRR